MRYYLSYANEGGFRGAVYVEAESAFSAVARVHQLELSPGGQVLIIEVPSDVKIEKKDMNRLLTKEEAEEIGA